MTNKEIKLNYLIALRKSHTIASLLDVPILILLYWLDYKLAFSIVLILTALSVIGYVREIIQRERELNLDI